MVLENINLENNDLEKLLKTYVDKFNEEDEEIYCQEIGNEQAFDWLKDNIPLFECPDPDIEEIYYFRWWTYRKHVKKTPEGYIITEFLPKVPWAGKYNSINCAAGFHIREGRWLRNRRKILEDTIRFWLRGSGNVQSYSTWIADAVWDYCSVLGDYSLGIELLDDLISNFDHWTDEHRRDNGLYWSIDDRDAMECSISGSGFRPTLNSYMYADAAAIARLAAMAGKDEVAARFKESAAKIKECVQKYLWNGDFFQVIPANIDTEKKCFIECDTMDFQKIPEDRNVKELIGYIPWYFNLPDAGYEKAFQYLVKDENFMGKAGLRTADKSHPRYAFEMPHECLWNGPAWPFATTQTLVALANLLRGYSQEYVSKEDYFRILKDYSRSQHRITKDGKMIPWIDEDQDPETGEWIARTILESWGWRPEKGGYERGKDYNHSMYCDLIITGLLGIEPSQESLAVKPLIPDDWDYFLLEGVEIHGKLYTIQYDRDGERYNRGKGLQIFLKDPLLSFDSILPPKGNHEYCGA